MVWRNSIRQVAAVGIGALLLAFSTMTFAQARLFGTVNAAGNSTLVELDPSTGALVNTIGPVGFVVNGLTWDAATNKLYGSTSSNGACAVGGAIITISLTTGAGTQVGLTGLEQLATITASPSGQLYGWADCSGGDDLASVNKTTGAAAIVGDAGLSTFEQTFAFNGAGVAYLLNGDDNLYTIDTTTGASTLVGAMTSNPGDLAFHHGTFSPDNGLLYTIDRTNNYSPANPRNIRTVDVTTRTIVATLPVPDNLHTIAFVPPVQPVPVNSTPMLLMLMALLLAGAGLQIARQRRAAK